MSQENIWDQFNKLLGPIVLFICTPIFAVLGFIVTAKEFENGGPSSYKPLVGIILIALLSCIFGIYSCNRSYGWFDRIFSKKK